MSASSPEDPKPTEPLRILMVCQANQCRSPMAAGLARVGTASVRLPAKVASAGFLPGGTAAAEHAVSVMGDRGIDIAKHRSHEIQPVDIDAADLIITMDPHHVLAIVESRNDILAKTFTLRELDRLGRLAGPRQPGESLASWLGRVSQHRDARQLLAQQPEDGIRDPIGGSKRDFERTVEELDRLVWAIVDLLAGYKPQA